MGKVSIIISLLLAMFRAVPMLKDVWERLLAAYIEREDSKIKEELRLAIYNAVHQKDQRGIEEVIGNPNAGKAVDVPDSHIVDSVRGITPHGLRNKKAD